MMIHSHLEYIMNDGPKQEETSPQAPLLCFLLILKPMHLLMPFFSS